MRKARARTRARAATPRAEIEKLVKAQVMENLRAILERQKSVREATQSLSSRVASGERQAVLRVRQLSPAEQRVVDIAAQTIELIEQTQFSVALPPAVHAIQRRCVYIAADLGNGQAGEKDRRLGNPRREGHSGTSGDLQTELLQQRQPVAVQIVRRGQEQNCWRN